MFVDVFYLFGSWQCGHSSARAASERVGHLAQTLLRVDQAVKGLVLVKSSWERYKVRIDVEY